MGGKTDLEKLCELLFEISNEERIQILKNIRDDPKKPSTLSKQLNLTMPALSRHLQRLTNVGLIEKKASGYYENTALGEATLGELQDMGFLVKNREYLKVHKINGLPTDHGRAVSQLSEGAPVRDVFDFLRHINDIVQMSNKQLLFLVDQFPINILSDLEKAVERGVEFKCIESSKGIPGPIIRDPHLTDSPGTRITLENSLVEQRIVDNVYVLLFISENKCAVSFPTQEGEFDYKGFTAKDEKSLAWAINLFQHYWINARPKNYIPLATQVKSTSKQVIGGRIHLEGQNDPLLDVPSLQEALNRYDEVSLRGTFNLGSYQVEISRSVSLFGEGRSDDLPHTRIYKTNWVFPFSGFDSVIKINGADAHVTIENIHFSDFNCSCIHGHRGSELKLRNNLITLSTGLGRGWKNTTHGDTVTGIWLDSPAEHIQAKDNFREGITISGNKLDFNHFTTTDGSSHPTLKGIIQSPEGRDEYSAHNFYVGVGINIMDQPAKIMISGNNFYNMNGVGVCVRNMLNKSEINILKNDFQSNIPGSYPFGGGEAGIGVYFEKTPQKKESCVANIVENFFGYRQANYCAVSVFTKDDERDKQETTFIGAIKGNKIHLTKGIAGLRIHINEFEIKGNELAGDAYSSVILEGVKAEDAKRAIDNLAKENDFSKITLRPAQFLVRKDKRE